MTVLAACTSAASATARNDLRSQSGDRPITKSWAAQRPDDTHATRQLFRQKTESAVSPFRASPSLGTRSGPPFIARASLPLYHGSGTAVFPKIEVSRE